MKRAVISGLVASVLIAAIAIWIAGYRGSPAYAVAQIESAIEEGNRLRFQRYVDLDQFLETAVDQVTGAELEEASGREEDGFEALGAALGAAFAEGMKPMLVSAMRRTIMEGVEQGDLVAAFEGGMGDAEEESELEVDPGQVGRDAGVSPSTFAGVGEIEREEDQALLPLHFRQEALDTTLTLQLRMERVEGTWMVVAPENLDSYSNTLTELQEAKLAEVNAEARVRTSEFIEHGTLSRERESLFGLTTYEISGEVINVSDQDVRILFAWVMPPGVSFTDRENALLDSKLLDAGESTVLSMRFSDRFAAPEDIYFDGDPAEFGIDVALVTASEGGAPEYIGTFSSWSAYQTYRENPAAYAQNIWDAPVNAPATSVDEIAGLPNTGPWIVNEDTNPLDDSPIVTLLNMAEEGRAGYGSSPALVLRCRDNTTEVYINWSAYLGSDRSIVVSSRVGDAEVQRRMWGMSTDNRATFYPNADIAFIQELATVDRFVAQITPYKESPTTAIWDVSRLDEHVDKLATACNWN